MTTRASSGFKASRWAGRIASGFVVLFLLFDSVIHVLDIEPVVKAFAQIGFPGQWAVTIGVVELVCIVLYVIPRTTVLGAVLLTGYLGGATAIQARLESPWLLFPVALGVLIWTGLFLRDRDLRSFLPLRAAATGC